MKMNESKTIQSEIMISSQRFPIDMNPMTTRVCNEYNDNVEDQGINNLLALQTYDPGGLKIT